MQNITWFVLWAIVPLFPAVIIYLLLPESSNAGKGLKGIKFKVVGAACLYILVFFTMNPVRNGLVYVDTENNSTDDTSYLQKFQNDDNYLQLLKQQPLPQFSVTSMDTSNLSLELPDIKVHDGVISVK